jgi:hypothetical protein
VLQSLLKIFNYNWRMNIPDYTQQYWGELGCIHFKVISTFSFLLFPIIVGTRVTKTIYYFKLK